jgi:hypothetical protein
MKSFSPILVWKAISWIGQTKGCLKCCAANAATQSLHATGGCCMEVNIGGFQMACAHYLHVITLS